MKHIHIVEPYHSAAMQQMSAPLADLEHLYKVTLSEQIDPAADLNFHIPWHTLVGVETGNSKHVIMYTHCNRGAETLLMDACERADLITAMSFTGRDELLALGVDPKKIWVIYAGADVFQYRKRVIGIVGFPQPNGRKRESLLLDLAWKYDLSPFHFLFVGEHWAETVAKLRSLGVTADAVKAEDASGLTNAYRMMDLLLVTGYAEGGPLPLLEAMASGVRVLSPDFGYAADLLDGSQIYTDMDDLWEHLTEFAAGSIHNHQLARSWSWNEYAAEHALIFGRLLSESVDLYPDWGMSRYAQLLDVIDEIRPQSVIEIGTWKGNRAIQMIQQASKYRAAKDIYYQGFDLFEGQTAEDFRRELSKAGWSEDVVQRRIAATGAFVSLEAGYTTETITDLSVGNLYFIDGGHSEETIENDGQFVLAVLPDDAVVIFDDYYHAGRPHGMGCNKFIDELDRAKYLVEHLPARTLADDGREIGMVKVRRYANIRLQMSQATYTPSLANVSASLS